MMHLFTHKLAGLGARGLSFSPSLSSSLDGFFPWHDLPPVFLWLSLSLALAAWPAFRAGRHDSFRFNFRAFSSGSLGFPVARVRKSLWLTRDKRAGNCTAEAPFDYRSGQTPGAE
jgi:hypothetical protein